MGCRSVYWSQSFYMYVQQYVGEGVERYSQQSESHRSHVKEHCWFTITGLIHFWLDSRFLCYLIPTFRVQNVILQARIQKLVQICIRRRTVSILRVLGATSWDDAIFSGKCYFQAKVYFKIGRVSSRGLSCSWSKLSHHPKISHRPD